MRNVIEKDLHSIQLWIIDDFQNKKTEIILLDLIIMDHTEFVRESNQLNVTLMRKKDRLIVITDICINESEWERYKQWIIKIIFKYKHHHLIYTYTSKVSSYISNSDDCDNTMMIALKMKSKWKINLITINKVITVMITTLTSQFKTSDMTDIITTSEENWREVNNMNEKSRETKRMKTDN